MPTTSPTRVRLGALALLAAAVAACGDRTPVSGGVPPGPAPQATKLACTVRVRAATMTCAPSAGTDVRGNLIVGGQGLYVQLTTSNVHYDGAVSQLSAQVTLQNLMPQPMGTADGTTPTAQGNLVFFDQGPAVTEGTGTVAVANPDTTGTFTGAGQPAFRYPGIIQTNQTSAPKTWTFDVPATVATFEFIVYVYTTLPNEGWWVSVSPPSPTLAVGDTMRMTAVVRTAPGGYAPDQQHTWVSSDTNVATVDTGGLVTARSAGTASITATSPKATGSQTVTVVSGSGDMIPPTVTDFFISPGAVDPSDGPVQVTVPVSARDGGSGVDPLSITALFRSPSGHVQATASQCALTTGTSADGTWSCAVTIAQYAENGGWTVEHLHVEDAAGNATDLTTQDLRDAGFPVTLQVNGTQDLAAPYLAGFEVAPEAVDVRGGGAGVSFHLSLGDSLSGVANAVVFLTSPSETKTISSDLCSQTDGTPEFGGYDCALQVPRYVEDGIWSLSVEATDQVGNSHRYSADELKRLGFSNAVDVTSTSDTVPPTISRFSFAPDSVTVTDSTGAVTHATVRALDGVSGVASVSVSFTSPTGFNTAAGCTMTAGTGIDGTWKCDVPFDPGVESGDWTASVEVTDNVGNVHTYAAGDLQGLGLPHVLHVTNTSPPPTTD
jgi:hypothetical protein